MAHRNYGYPSDYLLINRTRDFFFKSLEGKVTDRELLTAWGRFYRWYDPIIRRFAVSCGTQPKSLEDVVQTSWTIVIRDLKDFDCDPSLGSFRAWLFVRVRNAAVDQIREAERRHEHCVGVGFEGYVGPHVDPQQLFEQQWDEAVLHEALGLLESCVSDLDYKLFVMRHFHEMSVAELAEDTGSCECTIRSKLHRTMKSFLEIVEKRGYRDLMFQSD